MRSLPGYDAWLEEPYQRRCAEEEARALAESERFATNAIASFEYILESKDWGWYAGSPEGVLEGPYDNRDDAAAEGEAVWCEEQWVREELEELRRHG